MERTPQSSPWSVPGRMAGGGLRPQQQFQEAAEDGRPHLVAPFPTHAISRPPADSLLSLQNVL